MTLKTTHFLIVFPLDSESKWTNCWACSDHPYIDKAVSQAACESWGTIGQWADG